MQPLDVRHLLLLPFCLLLCRLVAAEPATPPTLDRYHDYEQLGAALTALVKRFPGSAHLYSIGTSVQGRQIWVIAIAATDADKHVLLRPEVKYVANMHGDETVGRALLLALAYYLLENRESDEQVRRLLDTARVHLLPSLNPDGFELAVRHEGDCYNLFAARSNANLVDLNRNFPYRQPNVVTNKRRKMQPETRAVVRWLRDVPFVLSANFHGGTTVVNYPFDANFAEPGKVAETLTDDDDVFVHLAKLYVRHNPSLAQPCDADDDPPHDGITNGAAWYPVFGGMQDYNYVHHGVLETTVELSCCKHPLSSDLAAFWHDNRRALVHYLLQVNRGIRGRIVDARGRPVRAEVLVEGRERSPFNTTEDGEYWRVLLPGSYVLQIKPDGFPEYRTFVTLTEERPLLVQNITVRKPTTFRAKLTTLRTTSRRPTSTAPTTTTTTTITATTSPTTSTSTTPTTSPTTVTVSSTQLPTTQPGTTTEPPSTAANTTTESPIKATTAGSSVPYCTIVAAVVAFHAFNCASLDLL